MLSKDPVASMRTELGTGLFGTKTRHDRLRTDGPRQALVTDITKVEAESQQPNVRHHPRQVRGSSAHSGSSRVSQGSRRVSQGSSRLSQTFRLRQAEAAAAAAANVAKLAAELESQRLEQDNLELQAQAQAKIIKIKIKLILVIIKEYTNS